MEKKAGGTLERRRGSSSPIAGRKFLCSEAVSNDTDSIFIVETESAFSKKSSNDDNETCCEEKRGPEKKDESIVSQAPVPSNHEDCFSASISSCLSPGNTRVGVSSYFPCSCTGGCGYLCGSNSTHVLASRKSQDVNSNPVIEALGVVPKSRDKINKYRINGAMNKPGNSIPTPAPHQRKKYSPIFSNIPEALSAGTLRSRGGCYDNDAAFLPSNFVAEKENEKKYSEEELQTRIKKALVNHERELMTKSASSDETAIMEIQLRMQAQIEERGMVWNKEMQEQLETARNNHKKKQSALKARVAELEQQCQSLRKMNRIASMEHEQQMDELRYTILATEEENEKTKSAMQKELAAKNEKLLELDKETAKINQNSSLCTPSFIREVKDKLCSLQAEKEQLQNNEATLQAQINSLETQVTKLERVVSGQREMQKHDESKFQELFKELESSRHQKGTLEDEIAVLQKKLEESASREKEVQNVVVAKNLVLMNIKGELQNVFCLLSVLLSEIEQTKESCVSFEPEATSPGDGDGSAQSAVQSVREVVNKLTYAVKAYVETRQKPSYKESDNVSAVPKELEMITKWPSREQNPVCVIDNSTSYSFSETAPTEDTSKESRTYLSAQQSLRSCDTKDNNILEFCPNSIATLIRQIESMKAFFDENEIQLDIHGLSMASNEAFDSFIILLKGISNHFSESQEVQLPIALCEDRSIRSHETNSGYRDLHSQVVISTNKATTKQSSAIETMRLLSEQLHTMQGLKSTTRKDDSDEDMDIQSLQAEMKKVFKGYKLLCEGRGGSEQKVLPTPRRYQESLSSRSDDLENIRRPEDKGQENEVALLMAKQQSLASAQGNQSEVPLFWDKNSRKNERKNATQKLDNLLLQFMKIHTEIAGVSGVQNIFQNIHEVFEYESEVAKMAWIEEHALEGWKGYMKATQAELHSLRNKLPKQQTIASKEEETKLGQLNSKVDELENDLEEENKTLLDAHADMENFQQKLAKALEAVPATQENNQDTSKTLSDLADQFHALKAEKLSLTKELSELRNQEIKGEEQYRQQAEQLQEELRASKAQLLALQERIIDIESELRKEQSEQNGLNMLLIERSTNIQEEIMKRTSEFEEKSKATIEQCHKQVKELKENHTKEIDELLSQLDLIEAEQKQICDEKEEMVKEKETIIAALGAQLAESHRCIATLNESLVEKTSMLETAQASKKSILYDLDKLREAYAQTQEAECAKIEKAVKEAREETIQKAEAQFEAANSVYRNLLREYKAVSSRVESLEFEVGVARTELENAKKTHEAKIAEMNSDFAASHAKAEAGAAQAIKEVANLKEAERSLLSRLREAETIQQSSQQQVATITAQKEKLRIENEELKAVAEEAMSLAETTHSQPATVDANCAVQHNQ